MDYFVNIAIIPSSPKTHTSMVPEPKGPIDSSIWHFKFRKLVLRLGNGFSK